MSSLLDSVIEWMQAEPAEQRPAVPVAGRNGSQESFLTGPALIDRIVRAIELDQSVILTGPRGCGKSWCVEQAILRAQEQKIIPPGASVFLQGNREIPRDYLGEDDIAFETRKRDGGLEVIPTLRAAPLFRFAQRDEATREIKFVDEKRSEVVWDLPTTGGMPSRFILFLDEVNRFSDGVLDSLLSVLEERKAVLAGREIRVPVVVCMTMNPPGYDGSARRLSPPLAARIGRSFRLQTPDLDTLSDLILPGRLKRAGEVYEAVSLRSFPDLSPDLLRRASLVTLCLWGDVRDVKKMGREYLTPEMRELLEWVMESDPGARQAMQEIGELCQFGPDGRAVGDWAVAAAGAAMQQASGSAGPVLVEERHFLQTVREAVAHKIYDNFSPASRPDLTLRKEEAIARLAQRVFKLGVFKKRVYRLVDDKEFWKQAGCPDEVRQLCLRHQVTSRNEVHRWLELFLSLDRYSAQAVDLGLVVAGELIRCGLAERSADGEACAFLRTAYEPFSRSVLPLLQLDPDLVARLDACFLSWSAESNGLRLELLQVAVIADHLQVEAFLALCDEQELDRRERREVARALDALWNLNLELAETPENDLVARGVELVKKLSARPAKALRDSVVLLEKILADRTKPPERKEGFLIRWLRKIRGTRPDPAQEELLRVHRLLGGVLRGLP